MERRAPTCVGRERELDLLSRLLRDRVVAVAIHGISGIGKSTLLEAFATRARARAVVVVSLDGHQIEPTERGFLHSLQAGIGGQPATTAVDAALRLGALANEVVLIVDHCELLRLLHTWQRQVFIPCLPANVRIVFAGRDPPTTAWLSDLGWEGRFQALALGPLEQPEALALLSEAGIVDAQAERILRFTRGHPLALRLAVAAMTAWHDPSADGERVASEQVLDELTRRFLEDIRDPLTRTAVEASSVARRITTSLLRAMLPEHAPRDVYERLRALPFVRLASDGLYLHDLVRETIAAALRARDPSGYRSVKQAAWQQLRSEIASADLASLWRYTADVLYLIENPVTREAFFPSAATQFTFEPARSRDADAIREIVVRHEAPEGIALSDAWWLHAARMFTVARGSDATIHGFYCMVEASSADGRLSLCDPVLCAWQQHLAEHPVADGEQVLFLRRWLSRDDGEGLCAVQAGCWLDIKRTYVEMRPNLRRVYLAVRDMVSYEPAAERLFFQALPECTVLIDGVGHHTALLDFGPRSVDGWLARLASAELGVAAPGLLDMDSHELVFDGERVPLTPLEFATFRFLHERRGKNVSRSELLQAAWGYNYKGESNLVDVVIRSLRKKLRDRATALQTVRGVGYRYRD